MSNASQPSETSHRHSRRKAQARVQLLGVLLLLVAAFAVLFSFAFSEQCRARWPEMVGVLFGGGAAVVPLFAAVWARQGWARYILIVSIFVLVAGFCLYLLSMMTNPADANGPGVRMLSAGVVALLGAGAWLILSKRIRYLTTRPGSGG